MNKTLIVLKHEFLTIVKKPSFWFGILGMPFVLGIIVAVIGVASGAATAAAIAQQEAAPAKRQGYVDQANLIDTRDTRNKTFVPFMSEEAAREALARGEIEAYYVVPADFIASGVVRMVANEIDDSPFSARQQTDAFEALLTQTLLGDEALATQLARRVAIESATTLAPRDSQRSQSFGGFSPLVYGVAILFFVVLMTASAYLMQAVTTEKENRVVEVLMSSVTPTQLLAGKILGLGLIGFIQLFLWFGSVLFAITSLPFLREFVGAISPVAVVVTVIYFVLGYFVYASLLAALGALMPGGREAAQYSFIVLIPLFIPLYLNQAISAEPGGTLAIGLSMFPFTSMLVMPMRLFATEVPMWQVGVSLALLLGLVFVTINLAARVFRAQSLLNGSKPTFGQVIAAFRG
jgi:ABC-2 type transport system permease protein